MLSVKTSTFMLLSGGRIECNMTCVRTSEQLSGWRGEIVTQVDDCSSWDVVKNGSVFEAVDDGFLKVWEDSIRRINKRDGQPRKSVVRHGNRDRMIPFSRRVVFAAVVVENLLDSWLLSLEHGEAADGVNCCLSLGERVCWLVACGHPFESDGVVLDVAGDPVEHALFVFEIFFGRDELGHALAKSVVVLQERRGSMHWDTKFCCDIAGGDDF